MISRNLTDNSGVDLEVDLVARERPAARVGQREAEAIWLTEVNSNSKASSAHFSTPLCSS